MTKRIFINLLFCFIITMGKAQEAEIYPDGPGFSREELRTALYVDEPVIESILYNDRVTKKQKSKKSLQATGFHEDAEIHFIIHFENRKLHGGWQSFYNNLQTCDSGTFVKNIPHGEWKTWYKNGQLKSIRNYNAKKFHYIQADIRRNHPKDQRYRITRYATKDIHFKKHFLPAYLGNTSTLNFTLLDKIRWNTADDKIYIAPFKTCLHHGAFVNYFENGLVKDSGYYHNGLKHELWTESTRDGHERAFGYYHHGLKHGQWKYYNIQGQLRYTETYMEGRRTNVHYFKNN